VLGTDPSLQGWIGAPVRVRGTAALGTAFAVVPVATASVGAALGAAAALLGAREATLDVADAVAAFGAERLLRVDGDAVPLWDPLSGDVRCADGWVRLHTNYPAHRAAALAALDLPARAGRADLERAAAGRSGLELEDAVHAWGGAAAALRTAAQWQGHPQAAAVAARPLVAVTASAGSVPPGTPPSLDRPLRVLDLTRVIAAPTATKVLAAFGADVLRLDPPGFEEVAAIVPDTTAGKRCAWLDLRTGPGLTRFDELVTRADVLVCGLRPGALARLGRPPEELLARNPSLVLAELSAYGDTGPWAGRRGFDSLVQTVCGIADEGMRRTGATRPVPLPVQALDHASGWLLAAGVMEAVRRVRGGGGPQRVGVVLARTAHWLQELPRVPTTDEPSAGSGRTEVVDSALGAVTRVCFPGELDGRPLTWGGPPSALGSHEARFGDG